MAAAQLDAKAESRALSAQADLRLMAAARAARVTECVAAKVTMKVTARSDVHSPDRAARRGFDRKGKTGGSGFEDRRPVEA
jgi:hypothetical protein